MNPEETLLLSVGCDEGVIAHCKKTAEIAEMYRGVGIDSGLVHSGAMLHDLGRSKTHSIHHADLYDMDFWHRERDDR